MEMPVYCHYYWQHDIVHVITFDVLGMTYHLILAAAAELQHLLEWKLQLLDLELPSYAAVDVSSSVLNSVQSLYPQHHQQLLHLPVY